MDNHTPNLYLTYKVIEKLSPQVINELMHMSESEQKLFERQYQQKKKSFGFSVKTYNINLSYEIINFIKHGNVGNVRAKSKSGTVLLSILGFILILAAITNPNTAKHKEIIAAKFNKCLQESFHKELNDDGKIVKEFGEGLISIMIKLKLELVVSTNNYVFFSTTQFTNEGEVKTVGIGAFGNVFIPIDDICSKIKKEMGEEVKPKPKTLKNTKKPKFRKSKVYKHEPEEDITEETEN